MKDYSIGYLDSLWRQAVLYNNGCRCILCMGKVHQISQLECHHIIKRRHKVLRWDYRNGVPLCKEHHSYAETLKGRREIEDYIGQDLMDYLHERSRWFLKDKLPEWGMSKAEFKTMMAEELKQKINIYGGRG